MTSDAGHMSGGAPVTPDPPPKEQTLTRQQWEVLVNEEHCAHYGHEWVQIASVASIIAIRCERCGISVDPIDYCIEEGHDLNIPQGQGEIISMSCLTCGSLWKVERQT